MTRRVEAGRPIEHTGGEALETARALLGPTQGSGDDD